ncbi:MAG: Nif3-like dinuclear metal center hexameric protein [Tissierellia bacterium]|nr:Nif3-like dinuclear metal center hexameric protein [Tissierellia bacterium]
METNINNIIDALDKIAPFETAEEWDNVGLIVGDRFSKVKKVLISLDITEKLIEKAIKSNCNTIIAHHPIIFAPQSSITTDSQLGKNLIRAIKNDINIISYHTNYDKAPKGTNYWLAKKLELENIRQIIKEDCQYVFVGEKNFKNIDSLKAYISDKLEMPIELIKLYGKKPKTINKISVVGGSGIDFMDIAKNESDLLITADIKHHDGQRAYENNFFIVDASHHYTEIHGIKGLKKLLEKDFKEVEFALYEDLEYMVVE